MELRVFGCVVLAYVSVYALFWLFDRHERLISREAPRNFHTFAREIGQNVADYGLGFFWFGARAFGVKLEEAKEIPPSVQIWGAVAVLFLVGFFFSDILCNEALGLALWEQIGLLALVVLLPALKIVRLRLAKK